MPTAYSAVVIPASSRRLVVRTGPDPHPHTDLDLDLDTDLDMLAPFDHRPSAVAGALLDPGPERPGRARVRT
ncbi:hypothetical protein GCM10009814_35190 [Lapillicoccus jejuensis]